ncbi:MAG TPA: hypothetical protein VGN63_19550 [Flavisolibacter sp.]|jgi:hypothetical protein|nr:hypothetical protein [Flavisolibacter sp.]
MTENQTLEHAADSLLHEGVTITVDVKPVDKIESALQRIGWMPKKRSFTIKPLVLGSLVRISKLMLSIDKDAINKDSIQDRFKLFNTNYELMEKHSRQIAEVIAVAVTNTKAAPSRETVEFFLYNLTPQDLMRVLTIVLQQIDVESFTASIISMRGLSVIETNPQTDQTEKNKASGIPSAA